MRMILPDRRTTGAAGRGWVCDTSVAGSGVVQAGCGSIGQRLKLSGMRWTLAGATGIAILRCQERQPDGSAPPRQPGELI
jgi:hypothetical protein